MNDKLMVFDWAGGDQYHLRYRLSVENDETNDYRIRMIYDPSDEGWSDNIRGRTAMRLRDYGNGVKIKYGNKKIDLDYSEICELFMLLEYYFKHSGVSDEEATVTKFLPVE